ncbi:MAG: PLP-dependent transferase, partial [Inquilinus limosus]|nr:PLP-dependent transferase [Inquilinus limosus]
MVDRPPCRPETIAARLDGYLCGDTGAIVPPIHPSSTYARDAGYVQVGGRGYSRDDNPTYLQAEALLARLEGGSGAMLFASGMAAIAALFQALAPGDHVVCSRDMYFGTAKLLRELLIPWGLACDLVD